MSDIDPLNELYRACNTAAEQVRRLKVRFHVRYRYCKLVHCLKHMLECECCGMCHAGSVEKGKCIKCWSIQTLHRIERLGGDADSMVNPIVMSENVKDALEIIRDRLTDVAVAAENTSRSTDIGTKKIGGEIACACDCHLEAIEAHLRQIEDMGKEFLITLV